MPTSTRDNQRQRLYDAEDTSVRGLRVSAAARKHLMHESVAVSGYVTLDKTRPAIVAETGEHLIINGQPQYKTKPLKVASIAQVQQYVDAVTTAAWFQRRWGQRKMRVVAGRGSHAPMWSNQITVSTYHRQSESVILHEMAHALTPPGRSPHGPEFAGIVLTLIKHVMGAEHAAAFREALREKRARYNLSDVPAPTKAVVDARAERAAETKRRKVEAAREKRIAVSQATSMQGTNRTAATLRTQIEAGVFGPTGSNDRKAALRVARVLEKHTP